MPRAWFNYYVPRRCGTFIYWISDDKEFIAGFREKRDIYSKEYGIRTKTVEEAQFWIDTHPENPINRPKIERQGGGKVSIPHNAAE